MNIDQSMEICRLAIDYFRSESAHAIQDSIRAGTRQSAIALEIVLAELARKDRCLDAMESTVRLFSMDDPEGEITSAITAARATL